MAKASRPVTHLLLEYDEAGRNGVNLGGLPYAADVERVMRSRGFRILENAG